MTKTSFLSTSPFFIDRDAQAVSRGGRTPTQQDLVSFAGAYRGVVRSLHVQVEPGSGSAILDFSPVHVGLFSCLQSLHLHGCVLERICLTIDNVPQLQNLTLSSLHAPAHPGDAPDILRGVSLQFRLPQLRTMTIENVFVATNHDPADVESNDDFGLSLSRCPNLQVFNAYKLRNLSGTNLCMLPSCTEFSLVRSECTERLEILQAPLLTNLSLRGCYDLKRVKLWDLPYDITLKDVEGLSSAIRKEVCRVRKEVCEWEDKWVDGTFGAKEALKHGWVSRSDANCFHPAQKPHRDLIREHVRYRTKKETAAARADAWLVFMNDLSSRTKTHPAITLPTCKVDLSSVPLLVESRRQFERNKRVTIVLAGFNGNTLKAMSL